MPILGVIASSKAITVNADYKIISTTTLTGTQASVSFSSNGAWTAYKHLRLVVHVKSNRGQYNDAASIWINNDQVSSEYRTQQMEFDMRNNNTWYGAGGDGTMIVSVPGSTSANYFGVGWIDFFDINGNTDKQIYAQSAFAQGGTASGQNNCSAGFGVRENSGAVTSFSVTLGASSFVAGTTMSLYGIRG
jgi:hypothetical protein